MARDERQKGEHSHAHREERKFKQLARRNRLLGHWAAGLMGLTGEAADAYAREVVLADLDEPGDADVIRKLKGDFERHGLSVSDDDIRAKLAEFTLEARQE